MLDSLVLRLLEHAVNTSCKLAIVLLYAEHERLAATPQQLATRLGRDPWSVETSVRELVADGILVMHEARACYEPLSEWREAIRLLQNTYDDAYRREQIVTIVRDLDRYVPYREQLRTFEITVRAA